MSNKVPIFHKLGSESNRDDDYEEQNTNLSSILLPPKHNSRKSTNSSNYKFHHSQSRYTNQQDNNSSRSSSYSRRSRSNFRPIVLTQKSTQEQSSFINSNIENQRRSRPRSNNYRSNSKTKKSTDNLSQIPLTYEQIKKKIKDLYQEDIPDVREEHQLLIAEQASLIDDFNDEEIRPIKEALLQELKDQLEVFDTIILSLSSFNPSTLLEGQEHFNTLKREIKRFKNRLPIYARRLDLIFTIASSQVTIIKADTGSGKSTQLVQYLVDAGLTDRGQIVCTQPRRFAAHALSLRVAEEFGCKIGDEVGFHIGSSNPRISKQTRIRFVTDSILLNEYHLDRKLTNYSIVIVDEAHERRIDTDLLFGIMKICLKERNDIKLIIMSATLDEDLFCNYYDNACVINIPGRIFPIEDEYAIDDPDDYVDAAINKAIEIHASKQLGDILVFLTGFDEINRAIEETNEKIKSYSPAIILPLYGKLNEDKTESIFKRTNNGERKIIFATNVAETSLTIDGICHVIDSGMVKEVMWDSKRNIRALKIGYITQSSVKQRRGRAGRTAAGKCYHLYTFDTYESLDICPRAEILCIRPSIAVLKLKYLGVANDVSQFDWLESPSTQLIHEAIVNLTWLGALDSKTGILTNMGRIMAKLGLEPMLSAMILAGKTYNCFNHVLALAGMLNVAQNIWWFSKDDQSKQKLDEKRALFTHKKDIGGDHITLLRIFLEWNALGENKINNKKWCNEHMINEKSMKRAADFIREIGHQIDPNFKNEFIELNDDLIERIIRCICTGFFQHLAVSNGNLRTGYQLVSRSNGKFAQIHRSSTLVFAQEVPEFIIYHDILILNETNYLTAICPIKLDWLDKQWLNSLPQSPSQYVLKSLSIKNLGPALLLSIVGKKCRNIPSFQESLDVFIDTDYQQSQLTIFGHSDKLINAESYFKKLIERERKKLRTEVQEFEIIGTTRILLSAGAQVHSVMIEDEYVKVLLNSLPINITEDEIQFKCQKYGTVRNITMLEKNQNGNSALVTYDTCKSARTAVTQLSNEIWNDKEIKINPSYIRTSIHASRQNCKLKAYWFMTESECIGRVEFNLSEAAVRANEFFKQKNYHSRIHVNTINPTIKCTWPLKSHTGEATIYFQTAEQVQQVLNHGVHHEFRLERHRNNACAICILNVPQNKDEDDLKKLFNGCTNVVLIRGPKGFKFVKPIGVEDHLARLFNIYPSFQRQSVIVLEPQKTGCIEGYVEFVDEREMKIAIDKMNGMLNLIGEGKLRLTVHKQQQQKLSTKTNQIKKTKFVIKLSDLPSDVDEYILIEELNQLGLGDYITDVFIVRKMLPLNSVPDNSNEDNHINLAKLQSLFYDGNRFRSEPDIKINPSTNDGRVYAFILYNDPRDVTTAMEIYQSPDDPDLLKFGKYKLRLVPLLDHNIELNSALSQAIPNKIQNAIDIIKNDPHFSNLRLIQKRTMKNKQEILNISIRGTNILQIYKARTIFDDLMKGQIYKFHKPSWISIIFDPKGKIFLQQLQDRTNTYIWWHWKTTFLRIFGDEQATDQAYREIDTYIQKMLVLQEYSISIPIPQDCLRQSIQNSSKFYQMNNDKIKLDINVKKRLISISGDSQFVKQSERNIKNLLESFASIRVIPWKNTNIIIETQNICPVCTCEFDCPYSLQQCGHTFCRLCLMNYFESYVDSTMTIENLKICCPLDKCNVECLIRDIMSILGSEKANRLAMIAFKIYIRCPQNDLIQCLGNDCNQVYRPSKYSSTYFCDQCKKIYCLFCKTEYHMGMTCEQFQKIENQRKEEILLKNNLGNLPYKYCPKCRTIIEKYAGCNAMKCTQCTIAFCWLCSLIDNEDVHYHYTQINSPCYNKCFDQISSRI